MLFTKKKPIKLLLRLAQWRVIMSVCLCRRRSRRCLRISCRLNTPTLSSSTSTGWIWRRVRRGCVCLSFFLLYTLLKHTKSSSVSFLTGHLHHRIHVVWQPKAISEKNKEKSQDHECEGQLLPLFAVCLSVVAMQGTAAHSRHRPIPAQDCRLRNAKLVCRLY